MRSKINFFLLCGVYEASTVHVKIETRSHRSVVENQKIQRAAAAAAAHTQRAMKALLSISDLPDALILVYAGAFAGIS